MLDEGWKINDERRWADRKILLRDADGTVGEVQIIPDALYRAEFEHNGHAIYERSRVLPRGAERSALEAQLKDLYDAANAQLGAEWNVPEQPYPRPIFRPRLRWVTADASAPAPDQRPSQAARADAATPPWPMPNATSQAPPRPGSGTTDIG
jgi:hypothetical protein